MRGGASPRPAGVVVPGLCGDGQELDFESLDPRAFDLDDAEAERVRPDLVSGLRRPAEQIEHVARDCVVILVLQVGAELLVEVVDRERPVDPDRGVVDALDRLVRQVELVLDVADDLLDQVLERHDPLRRPVLVHDDGEMLVHPAELCEERGEVLRLRDDVDRAQEILDPRLRQPVVERCDQIPDVQDPDDRVQRLAVDRIAGIRRRENRRERLFG
jgi:hypothetical protein